MIRNPSRFTSCSQFGPEGGQSTRVGKHGLNSRNMDRRIAADCGGTSASYRSGKATTPTAKEPVEGLLKLLLGQIETFSVARQRNAFDVSLDVNSEIDRP